MKPARVIWIGAMLVLGCGRSQITAPDRAIGALPPDSAASAAACPIGVEGARIEVADAVDGIDLTITSAPERVAELRQRARDAASLHGVGAHEGLGHHGEHLGAQRHGLRLTELPPLEARVEDVDGGARMHLRAKFASQADELRSRVRERVDKVNAGPCD